MNHDRIRLIKKLLRRHRRELGETIGAFEAHVMDESSMKLTAYSGKVYHATATPGADYNDGGRDWLNVNDAVTGASVACLD
jgi:hypothetical protein